VGGKKPYRAWMRKKEHIEGNPYDMVKTSMRRLITVREQQGATDGA